MGSLLPLHIFPEGALTHSVITTVWIGVFVVAFFNLRFGWPLSGIVIPGYIVPLMMAKPWAAITVLVEAILTYWLVYFFSNYLSKYGKWNSFFGRDRFFALILGSLVIRILLDGWILPILGQFLNTQWGLNFDYASNLRSFGLIITALMANYFWKPGLRRGFICLLTIIGTTFLLIRFILMEMTNFNIGRIEYMFEDLVAFFLASPKAYIIIIITSFMASRMNVRYGWEYSGIMIPSLLALQWYQPLKLAATLFEAIVILGISSLIMRLPIFRNITIEGARKLLLFFNISFAYKFLLGHFLILSFPHVHISDYYGFGYLLTTLIAIKMHQKDFLPQMTRSIFQTSLVAVMVASIIGFSLTLFSQMFEITPINTQTKTAPLQTTQNSLMETLQNEKLILYKNRDPENIKMPSPPNIDTFADALRHLENYISTGHQNEFTLTRERLSHINYQVNFIQKQYLLLKEIHPYKGGGLYIFNLNSSVPMNSRGLVIEIPAPLDESLVLEAGTWLFQKLNAKALAISGTSRKTYWDKSTDVLINPQTFFHTFHRIIAKDNVMQIRTQKGNQLSLSTHHTEENQTLPQQEKINSLWVKTSFPPGLSISKLKEMVSNYNINWESPPMKNIQRQHSHNGFAELFLNRSSTRRIMLHALIKRDTFEPQPHIQRIDGYLQEWLLGNKEELAERGSNRYSAMKLEELMFFDQEVLTPLLITIQNEYQLGQLTPEGEAEIRAIDAAASLLGYRFYWYRHLSSNQNYLILAEFEAYDKRRYNGTYVFRMGQSQPYIVQIPRPLYERNSFEYGVYLFERLNAKVLMISGAHPHANIDHSADLSYSGNKINLFNLINQVILRESGNSPLMLVACRGFGHRPDRPTPKADVLVALGDWANSPDQFSVNSHHLWDTLIHDGNSIQLVDGSPDTAGYEVGMNIQFQYLNQTVNKEFAVLWLSPALRENYRQQSQNRLEEAQFISLGINTQEIDLFNYLNQSFTKTNQKKIPIPKQLKTQVEHYILKKDIVILQNIIIQWNQFSFQRVIDLNSRDSFLIISPKESGYPSVANLTPISSKYYYLSKETSFMQTIQQYVNTRALWLFGNFK